MCVHLQAWQAAKAKPLSASVLGVAYDRAVDRLSANRSGSAAQCAAIPERVKEITFASSDRVAYVAAAVKRGLGLENGEPCGSTVMRLPCHGCCVIAQN